MSLAYDYGYAQSGIVPVRSEPVDASEMGTQLLLGETFQILETRERWFRIEANLDGYQGWVNRSECGTLTKSEYTDWINHPDLIRSWNYSYRAYASDSEAVLVPPAALVIAERKEEIRLPHGIYRPRQETAELPGDTVVNTARAFMGTPYLWGGRTDVGIDCSGLIQTVLLLYQKTIPCDSWKQQAYFEQKIATLGNAKSGDVVFFNPSSEKVSHVGFYLGDGILLHASGKVRMNTILSTSESGEADIEYNDRLAQSVHSIFRPLE